MSALVDYFRGTALIRITGAWPEGFLNRLAKERIAFWDTEKQDDFSYKLCIHTRNIKDAEKLAKRAMCDCRTEQRFGFRQQFGQLRFRVFLILLASILLTALCILPQFIWTLDVQGCESLHEEQVLRALETLDIQFGTWGPGIDSQDVKNHMLAILPELEWIAINRSGGHASVLVQERRKAPELTDRRAAGNIVASRTGIIVEMQVLAGEAIVKKGQTVLRGELLVSGLYDRTTGVQMTHAMAEVYARTWRQNFTATPSQQMVKTYTGKTKTVFSLVLGGKRINFYGSSGISYANCDKMTQASTLTLPGGFSLPITLIEETYREYVLSCDDVDAALAQERLEQFTREYVFSDLVGGRIDLFAAELRQDDGVYVLESISECTEQIALEVPTDPN